MEEGMSQGAVAPSSGNVVDNGGVGIDGGVVSGVNSVDVADVGVSPVQGELPWYNDIKQDYHEFLSKWGSPEEFIHGAFNQSKMLGKKVSEFSNDDWQSYNNAMRTANGIPTNANEYALPDTLPDGRVVASQLLPEGIAENLQKLCHDYELTSGQAEELMTSAITAHMDALEQGEMSNLEVVNNCYDYIDSAWAGAEHVKTAQIQTACTEVLPAMIGRENTIVLMDALAQHGLHLHPAVMNFFSQIGGSINTGRSNGYSNIAPEDAGQCLEAFKNDIENQQILARPYHPKFKQKSAELQTLISRSNGQF